YVAGPRSGPAYFPYTTLFRSSARVPVSGARGSATAKETFWESGNRFGRDSLARPLVARLRRITELIDQPPFRQQLDCPRHSEDRSEEHTSQLQSRVDLVCRLL